MKFKPKELLCILIIGALGYLTSRSPADDGPRLVKVSGVTNRMEFLTMEDVFRHTHGATSIWLITCDQRLRRVDAVPGNRTNFVIATNINLFPKSNPWP